MKALCHLLAARMRLLTAPLDHATAGEQYSGDKIMINSAVAGLPSPPNEAGAPTAT